MLLTNKEINVKINKQFKQYLVNYWFIHDKYRNPKELFDLQCSINDIINEFNIILLDYKKNNEFKKTKKDRIYVLTVKNLEFIISINKLLVDDIIIKYICEGECSLFSQLIDGLNESNSDNTSYDYDNILTYLNIAKSRYLKDDVYVVVCDLSSKSLKCGDILTYSNYKLDFVELKAESVKNTELLELVVNKGNLSNLNKYDRRQAERLLKQKLKHDHLDKYYNAPMYDPQTLRFFELNTFAETYLNQLKEDINKLNSINFIENKVDNCISYLVVNYNKETSDELLKTKLNQYKPNGLNVYTYDEFIDDPVIARPYELNWGKRIYKKLLTKRVVIYIKIDLKQLFLELKNYIPSLKIRKADVHDYNENPLCIIGDRMIYFDTKKGPFYIGKMYVLRSVARLYFARSAAEYCYNSILKYFPTVFDNI